MIGKGRKGWNRTLFEILVMLAGLFALNTIILLIAGAPPIEAFKYLFQGSLGSWIKIGQVLTGWIPLTLCACGLVFSFRVGLWNIGVEGQVLAGAVCATAVLRLGTDGGAPSLMLVMAFLGGVLGGSLWAVLAGVLKTKGGVNEIFGGLGLNFVAQGITLWLIFGPWKRPGIASMSGTEVFPKALWLPAIQGLRINPGGLALTVGVILLTGWMLRQTRLGLALKGIGSNPRAAYLHGLKPQRYFIVAMALAGACAGMAGAFQVTGVYHRLIPSISSNYGYLALLVVMLAGFRLGWSPAIAFFFVSLNVGSIQLPMMLQVDSSLSGIIQGTFVLAALLLYAWRRKRKGTEP
ncbi:MAG: ABC transporter permease [Deltaproteobacteria bacterium]|nr:ABC transporter permease [Deltaproteobacteria bacterium]MBW2016045.1 ABC transporter permease [Deltaproteobacteria bacterium]MBW2128342.1 ABC transporter permease [Deltaproteobacteria bacterium]MBW2302144.1 ABC transporter permease [Deltaproteobacteria bacterium]